jgi:mannan endo-1,4-beta-mannosidase
VIDRYPRWAKAAAAGIVVLAGIALAATSATSAPRNPETKDFVTRSGDKLMLNGHVFRFSGANIYWGGLDENGRTGLNYPTPFRVQTALKTAADMGETVVRCQTCGISTGSPYSVEPSLGVFSQTALRHIDYFVAEAQKYGIRLDIPLTDNYRYYTGGYHDFTDWLGLSTAGNCPSPACASTFYRDPKAISAFETYISVLLNHVNVYTGVPNKDNPTIMSWEVGNELPYGTGGAVEFTRWTGTISRFIKSIAPDQLVMDGALQLDPGDLALSSVDIQSPHLYPLSTSLLNAVASRVAAAGQALVVGEYAWNNPSGLVPFLADVQRTLSVSGDIYWDLLPQNDDFGFVEHYDGYQLHFPGDDADVGTGSGAPVLSSVTDAGMVADLRRHGYAMSGLRVPPYAVPAAPDITNLEHVASAAAGGDGNLVEWRGSAGAARYVVRRSYMGPEGPWTIVCTTCTDSDGEPFLDPGAGDGPDLWYEVTAVNPDGAAGPASPVVQLRYRTVDDTLNDFTHTYRHSAGVTIDTASPWLFGGDPSRAVGLTGTQADYIVWHVPTLRSFEAVGYCQIPASEGGEGGQATGHFLFLLAIGNSGWVRVPAADVQLDDGAVTAARDWVPYIYTIDDIQEILPGASYVQVRWDGDAPDAAELGEARITYP